MSETTVALLPIHPVYADAILNGFKKVEFRKRAFKKNVNRILIYACHPVMKLVGYFDVDTIVETTPNQAWRKYGSKGCINKELYVSYYSGSDQAVAIRIKSVVKFDVPVNLDVIDKNANPPQSFRYVCHDQFQQVLLHSGLGESISA